MEEVEEVEGGCLDVAKVSVHCLGKRDGGMW